MLPVVLSLTGRQCLVVGGGEVALRKVEALLQAGAEVTVVAPSPIATLQALASSRKLSLRVRTYRDGEAAGYRLVLAATDSASTNRQVAEDAGAAGTWVNVADDPELCTFHLPARVTRGPLQIAVASEGQAPFAVRRLRQILERRFTAEWADWMAAAARFRVRVRALEIQPEDREKLFDAFFAATVDAETLAVRPPTSEEVTSWLSRAEAPSGSPSGTPETRVGFVSLVGAGPGDAGLLTLSGRERLMAADAVVFDRLAEPALPPDLPPGVQLLSVGKEAGHHSVPQEEIEAMLVRLAREGKRVVRFKGGDPCIFGRGGEEAEALSAAGVPFDVVPGVSAGTSVPIYAGIPVTFRDEAVRVTLVTAHESIKKSGPQVRWDLLAGDPCATLIGFMGVAALKNVSANLLAAGMDPEVPAAIIERGATPAQRVVRAPLRDLPAAAEAAGILPPAIFVIGSAVRHAGRLDWFTRRPLFGERLAIASPAGGLRADLERAGAALVEVPVPLTPAARTAMRALPLTGCLLRTRREVDAFVAERPTWRGETVAWCLGAAAASRAQDVGWNPVVAVSPDGGAAALIAALEQRRNHADAC
jgi:uroporphyrin-III C-methyltransferase / precorrin-2 dehydrogenase / sirohydrochlorin ferrochelatase